MRGEEPSRRSSLAALAAAATAFLMAPRALGAQERAATFQQAIEASGTTPPPPSSGGVPACQQVIAVRTGGAGFRSGGQTMTSFSVILSRVMNRPVIDKTGVTGAFDIAIRFDTQGLDGVPTPPPSTGPRPDTPPDPVPSLFTVLQDQLGLKLTADRAPIDVIVVDHAEHPTEN